MIPNLNAEIVPTKSVAGITLGLDFEHFKTDSDYQVINNVVETMTLPVLSASIKDLKLRGVNTIDYEIEKNKRTSGPFSAIILTIIGVSLASRKIKGGLGFHLGLGLLLSFSYILFMQITTVFATSGLLAPWLAMWIPNIIYGVLAFFLYRRAAQ